MPHAAARQLATQRTWVIGLLLTDMHNEFFAPLVSEIEAVVQQEAYNLLVATHRVDSNPNGLPLPIGPHNTDGMIVFASNLSDTDIVGLHKSDFPIILIHRSSPSGFRVPSVTIENKNATYRLVKHLIAVHGKDNILFVRGSVNQEDSHWREMAYTQAVQEPR